MVGIPGKSKGCHTCRKRKIKCDLQEPNCQRCIRSGRLCEGYKRGAVFLNRTPQGWEKRSRLEEALPRHEEPSVPPNLKEGPQSQSQAPKSRLPPEGAVQPAVKLLALPSIAVKSKFQGLFLNTYFPSNPKAASILSGLWLWEALHLNNPGRALEYSLHALSITRVGRTYNDQELVTKGTTTYGFALRELRSALESPKLAGKDETLAACLVLSTYEAFESTTNSTQGHENHISGIERLVQWRGPKQNETPLGRALIKNIVYLSMVKSVQYRKASLLKSLVDEMQWWDMQGHLYVKGHTLGALMEDLDRYKQSGQADMAVAAQYLQRCWKLNADFETWYKQVLKESPSPMFWKSVPPGEEPTMMFANLYIAHLMLDYWALRLILTTTIDIICAQVPNTVPDTIRNFVNNLKDEHGRDRQIEIATNIMLSISYCMRDDHGVISSQKSLFGGRVALYALRRHSVENLAMYEAKYLDLTLKKGLRYAENMSKGMRSGWDTVLKERGDDIKQETPSESG